MRGNEWIYVALDLSIWSLAPFAWVGYDPGAHHIEVNVSQAIPQMIAAINRSAMETVSPEGPAAALAEVNSTPQTLPPTLA
jgi:hypothetical protein